MFPQDPPSGSLVYAQLQAQKSPFLMRRLCFKTTMKSSKIAGFYTLFADRSDNWLTASNHKHLRITRILKSLRPLGLEAEAAAFFNCLADIYGEENPKITPVSLMKRSVSGSPPYLRVFYNLPFLN